MTKKAAKPEVLAPEDANTLIGPDGSRVGAFMAGLVPFFARATELETNANATLARVKAMGEPTSLVEDTAMKEIVRGVSAEQKQLGAHWLARAPFFAVHKLLTAAFKRADAPLEQAKNIAQGHHNAWTRKDNARIERERQAVRDEQERQFKIQQKKEADDLEDRALALEATLDGLSERESRFVDYMAKEDRDPEKVARHVGYKNPEVQGPRLMANKKIKVAIAAAKQAAEVREQKDAVQQEEAPPIEDEYELESSSEGDRKTKTGTFDDVFRLLQAYKAGANIPESLFLGNQPELNRYARAMGSRIEQWPGVSYHEKTRTV